MRKRELTTAWNSQYQKKKRVNICIKIWLESSLIHFYLFSSQYVRHWLEKLPGRFSWFSWSEYQWQSLKRSFEGLLPQMQAGWCASVCPCYAAILSPYSPSTLTSPSWCGFLPFSSLMFQQGQNIDFLFLVHFQEIPFISLSSSSADPRISLFPTYSITSESSDSFPGAPQIYKLSFFL